MLKGIDFKKRFEGWKLEIKSHKKIILLSVFFFIIANIINQFAGHYVDKTASGAVSDLILDHLPVINLTFIFSYGYIFILILFFAYPLLFKIKELHSSISQFSLLILIRSFFIILTHLRAPLDAFRGNLPAVYSAFSFSNDLFFSGHVALCFLGFLIYKNEKIGKFFLISTLIMAFTVLVLHIHYSIDVFAAFFITYGSFKIGRWLFKKLNHY